jgi:hypothetical protein
MEVTFASREKISDELSYKMLNGEAMLDYESEGWFYYVTGTSADGLEEGEEDPYDYDDCVRVCGILYRHGIEDFVIEGCGGWAMGRIMKTDFSDLAVDDDTKAEYKRISDLFWKYATPEPTVCLPAKENLSSKLEF